MDELESTTTEDLIALNNALDIQGAEIRARRRAIAAELTRRDAKMRADRSVANMTDAEKSALKDALAISV